MLTQDGIQGAEGDAGGEGVVAGERDARVVVDPPAPPNSGAGSHMAAPAQPERRFRGGLPFKVMSA